MEEFKGNSNASKETMPKKDIKPIVTNAIERNNNTKKRPKLISSDARNVGSSVLEDIIIPKVQDMIVGAFKYAIDFVFYGRSGAGKRGQPTGIGQVSYSSYYRPQTSYMAPITSSQQIPSNLYNQQTAFQIKTWLCEDRGKAEEILIAMNQCINRYGSVSINDYYEFMGQHGTYTDTNYGWYDLSQVQIVRCDGKYLIDLPKAVPLK